MTSGRQPLSFADERLPVADGANDLELWLEQPAPAPERRRVIVSEQHSHATHRPSSRRLRARIGTAGSAEKRETTRRRAGEVRRGD